MKTFFKLAFLLFLGTEISAQEKIIFGDCINGFGIKMAADKTSILGYFQNGQLNGYALAVMPNGDTYAGMLKNNACWGKGIFLYSQGLIYIGDYENNMQNGYGTAFIPNSQIIDGTFANNQPAQVIKMETKNSNSDCLYGDCDKGPGLKFASAQSFSCIGKEMILERRPDGYNYFGPRSGAGYMTIYTNDYIYVGMGKDRLPNGEGGKYYPKTAKVDYGIWTSVLVGDEPLTTLCEPNSICTPQITFVKKFKIPVQERIWTTLYSNDCKKIAVALENKSFGCYDVDKNTYTSLSGTDKVNTIAMSNDGKYGAYCTDAQIKVFDLTLNKLINTINDSVYSDKLIISANNKYLLYNVNATATLFGFIACPGHKLRLTDLKKGQVVKDFTAVSNSNIQEEPGNFNGLQYSYYPQDPLTVVGNHIFTNSGSSFDLIHCLTGKSTSLLFDTVKVDALQSRNIFNFAVSPKGTRIAIVTDRGVDVINLASREHECWISETDYSTSVSDPGPYDIYQSQRISTDISSIFFSPDEKQVIVYLNNQLIFAKLDNATQNMAGYKIIQTIPISYFLEHSPDGSKLIYSSLDGEISLYEVKY